MGAGLLHFNFLEQLHSLSVRPPTMEYLLGNFEFIPIDGHVCLILHQFQFIEPIAQTLTFQKTCVQFISFAHAFSPDRAIEIPPCVEIGLFIQ